MNIYPQVLNGTRLAIPGFPNGSVGLFGQLPALVPPTSTRKLLGYPQIFWGILWLMLSHGMLWYPMVSDGTLWYPTDLFLEGVDQQKNTGCTPAKMSQGNDQEMARKHEATCKVRNMSKLRFSKMFYNIYSHDLIASDMITTNPKARWVCPNWAIRSTAGHV